MAQEKKSLYRLQLAKNFTYPTRYRLGIQFERNVPQFLELTKEQVKEVENDRYMEITKATKKEAEAEVAGKGKAASSKSEPTTDTTDEEETDTTTEEDSGEGEDSVDEEETDGEPEETEADTLARENSINDLRAQARELNIEDVMKKNKITLAQEIVEARKAS